MKQKESIVKTFGIKKKKGFKNYARKKINKIEYDTLLLRYTIKPYSIAEVYFVHNDQMYWRNYDAFCQIPRKNKDCVTFCLQERPAERGVIEVFKPKSSCLPKGVEVGIKLENDEEWIIAPTKQEVYVYVISNHLARGGLIQPSKADKEKIKSTEQMMELQRVFETYTNWIGINCENDDTAIMPYLDIDLLSYALYKKGYSTRKITNSIDAQFINEMLKYQKDNNLRIGLIDSITLESLKLDKKQIIEYLH